MEENSASQPESPPNRWREPLRQRFVQLRLLARKALPFVSGMVAAFAVLLLYTALVPQAEPLTLNDVNEQVVQAMASATPAPAPSALVYQAILPSLVFIQVEAIGEQDDMGVYQSEDGLGSGVVINTDGEVLTSLHVVTESTRIMVTFADGTEAEARIVATQPENDIAVLRPSRLPQVLVPAILGNPSAMNVGDEAYAVGHPFGLYASMTSGVISGFERTFRLQNSDQRLEGLIQIDAAVNPGNSGGPLLNRSGQVVGIVTGLANPTDESFFVGIGFAVPIDIAGGAAGLPPY
jgi:S1-C subfamily serine protease